MKAPTSLAALASVLAVASAPTAKARPTFVQRLPNRASVPGVRALGHQNPNGGGATNAFGEAFEAVGTLWNSEICHADTDGDGASNGEELGDPCCAWHQDGSVVRSTGITHPGIPNDFTPTELAALRCQTSAAHDCGQRPFPEVPSPIVAPSPPSRAAEKAEPPVAAHNGEKLATTVPASKATAPGLHSALSWVLVAGGVALMR